MLKLTYDKLLSSFALNVNLRRYIKGVLGFMDYPVPLMNAVTVVAIAFLATLLLKVLLGGAPTHHARHVFQPQHDLTNFTLTTNHIRVQV